MKRYIFYILILVPLVVWAAVTTITSAGNWSDIGIWSAGIADDISIDADMSNNIGIVTIQSGDNYTIGDLNMKNGNTLTIDAGGSLTIGSNVDKSTAGRLSAFKSILSAATTSDARPCVISALSKVVKGLSVVAPEGALKTPVKASPVAISIPP